MFIAVLAWYSGATTQRRFDPALLLLDGRHVLDLSVNLGWDELKQLLVDDAEVTKRGVPSCWGCRPSLLNHSTNHTFLPLCKDSSGEFVSRSG